MLDNLNSELSGNARKILVMLMLGEKSESEHVSYNRLVDHTSIFFFFLYIFLSFFFISLKKTISCFHVII